MAVTTKHMSVLVVTLGILAFIFGVIAENKKPTAGTPITGKNVVICKYPRDPTIALGILSFVFLVASSLAGGLSLFYPYKGTSIPCPMLFQNTTFFVFFLIALGSTGLAGAMLLWPTITKNNHVIRNVHNNLETTCPTAKTGLLGCGAFLALDAALFWLISLMLADNARVDYSDDVKDVDVEVDGFVQSA
ncbi:keratin-associated protein [Tanacetum coccineum]